MKKIVISNKSVSKIVYFVVLLFFVIPIGVTFSKFLILSFAEKTEHNLLLKSEYLLMTIQSLLGIFAINIPYLLTKKYKIKIPITFIILYDIFLFFLGLLEQDFPYELDHYCDTNLPILLFQQLDYFLFFLYILNNLHFYHVLIISILL